MKSDTKAIESDITLIRRPRPARPGKAMKDIQRIMREVVCLRVAAEKLVKRADAMTDTIQRIEEDLR